MATSVAAPAFAAPGGTARPFSESSTVTLDFESGLATGSGVATHLGRYALTSDTTTSVYTAANGETLTVNVQVVDTFGGGVCADSDFGVHATATVLSGTGRFQGAHGVFQETSCGTVNSSFTGIRFQETATGTISY